MNPLIPRMSPAEHVDFQLKINGLKFDAGETASFARELEYIQAALVEEKFPEFTYSSIVPIKTDAPMGARSHTWREVRDIGQANMLDNMAPEDFGAAEVIGAENTGTFRSLGSKYLYSLEELRANQMMSIKTEVRKASAARRSIESALDRLVWLGNSAAGFPSGPFLGLFQDGLSQNDQTAATAGAAANTTWTSGDVATKASFVFRTLSDAAYVASRGAFDQFDFVVSLRVMTFLGNWVPATTAGTGLSIMNFILQSCPRVRSITACDRARGISGANADRILCFPRSPEVLEAYVPIAFEQFAPQLRGMVFETYCHAKYGGIRVYHPNMIRRCDVTVA